MVAPVSGGLSSGRFTSRRWIAAGIAVGLILVQVPSASDGRHPVILVAQAVCCLGAGLAILRPLTAAAVLGALQSALTLALPDPYLGMAIVAFPVVIAICAARGRRIVALTYTLLVFFNFTITTSRNITETRELTTAVAFWLVITFVPLLLGEGIWRVHRRSERLREEQIRLGEQQRHAIARDLHDTLAYATTTMVMKADQARMRGGHDEQTLSDLEFIAATGRSATADLRTMLALLREVGEPTAAQPVAHAPAGMLPPTRLEEVLEAQHAKLTAFDFKVNLGFNGDPTSLPEQQSTVLARVLTELASNITKHGDPHSEVSIMIDLGSPEDDIEALFVNTLRAIPAESGHRGLGLLGLREIVEAAGGTLESGTVGDRWISHLILPHGGGESA